MSDGNARVLRPGHRISLGQDAYTVIQLNGTTVTLQDQHGELSAMLLGYLLTTPGFEALDAAPPKRAPQDGRLSVLDEAEQRRIRWLEGHLIELGTGRHPERTPRADYDPDLHTADERELAKLAELKGAGTEMTQRHLQRLRQAYRNDGLIGLADKRHCARRRQALVPTLASSRPSRRYSASHAGVRRLPGRSCSRSSSGSWTTPTALLKCPCPAGPPSIG